MLSFETGSHGCAPATLCRSSRRASCVTSVGAYNAAVLLALAGRQLQATRNHRARAAMRAVRRGPRALITGRAVVAGDMHGVTPAKIKLFADSVPERELDGHQATHRMRQNRYRSQVEVQTQFLEVIGEPSEGVRVLGSSGGLSASTVVVEDEGEIRTQTGEIADERVAHIARPSMAHQEGRTRPDNLKADLDSVCGQKPGHRALIPAEPDRRC